MSPNGALKNFNQFIFYLEEFLKNWNGRLLKVVCSKKDLLYDIGQILLKDHLYRIEWLDIDNFIINSKKMDFMILSPKEKKKPGGNKSTSSEVSFK
jgi:hypothetical protein